MNLQYQQIEALCQELKLPALQVQWSALAQKVADTQGSFADFLLAGLESERAARQERVRQALLKISSLPAIKSTHSAFRSLDKFSTPSLSAYGRRSQSPTPIAKRHSTNLIGGPS
jgi:DNA replication protein DnaC